MSDLRHGKRNLSSKVSKQFREELKLIQLLDHTLFLSRRIKTHDKAPGIELYFQDIQDGIMYNYLRSMSLPARCGEDLAAA